MTFFDEQGNPIDVTMQDLQGEVQQQYNYSLIGEEFTTELSLMLQEEPFDFTH